MDLLTVEEMLLYTAELKLPLGTDYKAAVEGVVSALSLQHCRNTRIGRSVGSFFLGVGVGGGAALGNVQRWVAGHVPCAGGCRATAK